MIDLKESQSENGEVNEHLDEGDLGQKEKIKVDFYREIIRGFSM